MNTGAEVKAGRHLEANPYKFVSVPFRGGPRTFVTARVRRETEAEQRTRQIAFELDREVIERDLKPGKAKFRKQITTGVG